MQNLKFFLTNSRRQIRSSGFAIIPLLFDCDTNRAFQSSYDVSDDTYTICGSIVSEFLHNLNFLILLINELISYCLRFDKALFISFISLFFCLLCVVIEGLGRIHIYFSWSGTERIPTSASSMYSQKLLIASYSKSLCNFSEESPRAYGPSQDKQRQLLKLAVNCKLH